MLALPDDPVRAGKLAIDWPVTGAASAHCQTLWELQRMAGPLVRQAVAEDAGSPDRVVLVTSANPAADPERLILIDGPPRSQPEGQGLALFAVRWCSSWQPAQRRAARSRPPSSASLSGRT